MIVGVRGISVIVGVRVSRVIVGVMASAQLCMRVAVWLWV